MYKCLIKEFKFRGLFPSYVTAGLVPVSTPTS